MTPLPLTPSAVLATMASVNSFFQLGTPVANNGWTGGTYMAGNMAHYRASAGAQQHTQQGRNESLLDYAVNWGEQHQWSTYEHDKPGRLTVADNICCGQGYIEIYHEKKEPKMIEGIAKAIDFSTKHACDPIVNATPCTPASCGQLNHGQLCWWWVDALFMALPTYQRMANITADPTAANAIRDRALANFQDTAFGIRPEKPQNDFNLWSPPDNLFYRDDTFIGKKTPSGKKIFWGRGNGWAIAAMARALEYLPATRTADIKEYKGKLVSMAKKLKSIQGADGCWRSSLEDAKEFPNIETTGTSCFTFAIAWGVNNKVLPAADYKDVAANGWKCMTAPTPKGAVHVSGLLGWCQPGGGAPAGPPAVSATSTSDFCVGQFLLAGSEMLKLSSSK